MRVALFAPTSRSLYSRLVASAIIQQEKIELVGIFVRHLWSIKRIRTDLRREGPRLLQKVYEKLIAPEAISQGEANPLVDVANERLLNFRDLIDMSRRSGIPFYRVRDFNSKRTEASLKGLKPDLVAFTGGGLIRKNILTVPAQGVLNCHSGLLPRFRGMDTLEWTILEAQGALPQVGLTLHFMDTGVDTGPILRQHRVELNPGESLNAVRKRLEPEMVQLMCQGVVDQQRGILKAIPQEKSAGRQYFVIHPRLQEKAEMKLQRSA